MKRPVAPVFKRRPAPSALCTLNLPMSVIFHEAGGKAKYTSAVSLLSPNRLAYGAK